MTNQPSHFIYHGRATGKDKGSKKVWTRIGVAWANKSGKGYNITWDFVPIEKGITVMLPYDKHQDLQIVPDEYPA